MKPRFRSVAVLSTITVSLFASPVLQAASDSWNVNAAGNWNANASWLSGTQTPGSTTVDSTDIATFSFPLTAARAVTVDTNRFIGGITFGAGNTSAFGYTLQTGNLRLNNGGVIQTTGAIGANTTTISSPILISGATTASATITSGATTVGNGVISITGAVTGSATASTTTSLTLNGTGTGANAISSIISNGSGGALSITKSGTGTWLLSGVNTYTGATTVTAGTLRATTSASALGAGTLSLGGGTLQLGNNTGLSFGRNTTVTATSTITADRTTSAATATTHTLGTLSIGAQTLNITRGTNITGTAVGGITFGTVSQTGASVFDTGADTTLTLGALQTTAQNITKQGTGTLVLGSAANAARVAGTNTLSAGTLRLGSASALGTTGVSLALNGGTLDLATDTTVNAYNTTVGGTTTINSNKATAASAGITHTLGTLSIGAQTLSVTRGANATSGTGGVTFGNATLTAAAILSPQANTLLTLGGTTALGTANNALTKSGVGSLTLTGVVSGGNTTAGNNSISITSGTLSLGSNANTLTGDVAIDGATSVLSIVGTSGGSFTTSGPLGNQASVYKSIKLTNGGTFRLSSSNYNVNTPNATNVGAGQVFNIGSGGGTFDVASGSTFTVDDGSGAAGTAWTAPQLQGSGALTKTGGGTLSLGSGTSNFGTAFTGTITVSAGTLVLGNAGSPLGNTASGTTIASGAALNVNGQTQTAAEPLNLAGTGLTGAPVGALTSSTGTGTWVGPITIASGGATIGGGAGALTLSSAATINGAAGNTTLASGAGALTANGTIAIGSSPNVLTINHGGGRITTAGVISGSGSVNVTGTTGDWVSNSANTYTGGTTLNAGSATAISLGSTGTAGNPTNGPFGAGTTPLVLNGGQIRSGIGAPFTVGNTVTLAANTTFHTTGSEKSLTFSGPVTITGATRTLTSNVGSTVAGTTVILNGAIDDGASSFGLIKAGTGNLTLGGANTYEGGTTVNEGLLVLSGSLLTGSSLSVSPTTAGGATFSLASGTANPLSNVSAFTLGSVTGPAGLGFELGTNTATSDSITTPNAATTSGTVNISILPLAGFGSASTYDLLTAPSGLSGATYALTNAPGGYSYSLISTATSLQLSLTPVVGDLYWRGNSGSSWSAFTAGSTNWFTDSAGSTNAQASPGAGNTVNFSTVNAPSSAGVITTTLDNNFTVNDLVFGDSPNGIISVTVAPGLTTAAVPGILAVAPSSSADGISVGSNAGAITISAPVILGANQTWSVNGTGANGSSLNVSGAITGSSTLDISGLVTLSAAAATSTYSGATNVPSGAILQGGATNSFSANSAVTVSGTGILRLNGFSNTILSLTGDGTVQNNHASTAATLTAGDATDFTFSGTLQNGGVGTLALSKTGAGILTLSGANTNTGGTTITAGTIRQGVANALTSGTALTINGTSVFDLNGFNASVSTLGGVSTGTVRDDASGSGTSTLSITNAGTSAARITDGASRAVALRVTNLNGGFALTNGSNTFTGGIVLTNSAGGTRLSPGTITAGAYGSGAITIGESATDQAGIYFATATQTLTNPIIFNTALGTDRVGIRSDVAGITLSGVITANLAPATFTANASGATFTLTNQVTGTSGLVLDITSLSAAATSFQVTLNNAAGTNNYQGDTVVNFNAASGKSATLQLLAANQIPNGSGTGNVFVNSNGSGIGLLSLAGGNETINGLNGSGNVASPSGTVTLTLGDNNANGSHSGSINNTAGTLSVTKIGTGTQTLSGASNFGGALTVNGGLVVVPSSPATGGPLGNSTSVILSGGGISHTGSGANDFNRTIAIGSSNGTVNVASATGVLNLNSLTAITSTGGNLIKTGPGTLLIPGSTTLNGGAAGVVINEGTLRAGYGSAGIATASVGSSGNLDLQNSAREALVLAASSGALTLTNGAQVGFELNGASTDSIAVAAGGTASTSGVVTLNFFGTPAAGTYNLLTADSGLAGATYALGSAPNGFNYTINASDTVVSVTISTYTPTFWRGGQDLSWNTLGSGTANWTDATGAVDATSKPTGTDTVIFSASGVTPGSILTTLDASFTVDSLQFSNIPGSSDVTIAAGTSGTLTLTPVSTSGGIRVLSGGGNATISAPLTVGAAQTWDVDPSGSLTISGDTTFTGSVNKTNTGVLTLSGSNSGAAPFTLSAGTLNLNSATAVGTGTFTIGAGTTLNTAAANTLTTNNAQNWVGDFTFAGTNNLNLGTGNVALGSSLAVTTSASTLTVGGAISDGGTNRGLTKAGSGTLVLNGANSYGGLTNITAGVLRITNATGLGAVTGGVTQSGTSALELDGTGADFSVGAEALTINGGGITNLGALRNIAGNNTYGGPVTLAAQSRINSDSGTLTLNNAAAVTAPNLTLVVGGAGNTNISGAVTLGSGGLAKGDGGSLTLGGTNVYSGNTTLSAGTLNITGSWTGNTTSSTLAIGGTAGNTVTNVSGNITAFGFNGGSVNGAVSVYNQTAGLANFAGNVTTGVYLASGVGSYGYLNITGGTFKSGRRFGIAQAQNVAVQSTGITYVGGTGVLDMTNSEWALNYSHGQVTVAGSGLIDRTGATNPYGIIMNSTVAGGQYGVLNVAGGSFVTTTQPIQFGNSTTASNGNNNTALINLAAGTLQVGTPMTTSLPTAGANNAYVNFAGGTLKTSAAVANWIPASSGAITFTSTLFGAIDNSALSGAPSFGGGLTFDSNGFNSSLSNVLSAAVGDGVAQSSLSVTGGSGYVGAPEVIFSGGTLASGGSPASGYALISGGAVTGIVITSPGAYTSAPSVTLTGGGGTGASVSVGTLVANTSGGLTKTGTGTLTLTGANTYTGATLVSAGTLQLNSSAAVAPTTSGVTVGAGGTLGFTSATASTLDLSGKPLTLSGGTLNFDVGASGINDAITVQDFTLTANSALTFNSLGGLSEGGSYTLLTSANPITNGGSFTLSGQTVGRVTLTPTINANTITVATTVDESQWGVDGNGNWSLAGNWTGYLPETAGDAALFGPAITAPAMVSVDTPQSVGYIRFNNANAYTIGSNGSNFLTLNNGASPAVVTVSSGSHTIAEDIALLSNLGVLPATGTTLTISGVVSGTGRTLDVNGPGTLVLSGANTYSGATTVNNATLSLTGSLTGGAAVTISGSGVMNQSASGVISGAATVTHNSTGTSILAGANTYTGATTVSNGTLTLSGNRTGSSGALSVSNLAGQSATLNISNGTYALGANSMNIGNAATTATGTVNQSGGAISFTSGNAVLVGQGTVGNQGIYNMSGGSITTFASATRGIILGVNSNPTPGINSGGGTFNLSGTGTLNMTAASGGGGDALLEIGRSDTTANNTTNAFNQIGGTANVGILTMGGATSGSTGVNATLSLTAGTFTANQFTVLSAGASNTSTITIGGTAQVTLPAIPSTKGAASTAAITFDSTTGYLRPTATSASYMPAAVFNGGAKLTANGAKIDTNGFDITIGQVLEDNTSLGTLTKSGLGNLTLSGVNTYTGTTTISAGTLTINEGSIAGSSNIVNNGALAYALTTNSRTYANAISGSGSLTKSGTNSLTLSGTNSYSGNTNVTGGTLQISGSTNTGSSTLNVGSGSAGALTVATGGSFTTTGALNLGSGSIGNALTVQTGATMNVGSIANPWGSNYTVNGTLTSAGAWTVSTTRTTDTFNGSGTINATSLTLGNATTGVNYSGTGAINLSGSVTVASNNGAGAPFYTQSSGTLNAAGMLLGDNVTNTTGSRTFSLTGGRVNLGSGGIASTGSTAATRVVNLGTGTLGASANWSSSLPMNLTTVAGVTINTLDSVDNTTARTITLSGVLSGASNSLTKEGAGILVLSGTNTYTGPTTIAEGAIRLGAAGTTGAIAPTSAITNNGSLVIDRSNAAAQGTDFGTISGTGSLAQAGSGTTTLNAANTYSGPTSITGGTLSVSADNNLGTAPGSATPASLVVNGGALSASASFTLNSNRGIALGTTGSTGGTIGVAAGTLSYGGVIADNGGTNFLTKTGAGTLTLSGANSYSGGTTISAGVINATTSNNVLGSGDITFNGGARLELGAVTLTNAINLGSNTGAVGRGLIEGTNGVTTLSGPISVTTGPAAGGTFATTGAGTLLNVDGAITATPASTVVSVRVGSVNFGGGGNYTDMRVSRNVGLNANNGIATTAVMTVGASEISVVDLKGFNQSLAGMIKGSQAASVVNSTASTTSTLTLANSANSTNAVILAGTGAGTLAFTQAGSAVQTLSGANTYTGATTVNSGTLAAGVASVANTSGAFGNNSAVVMSDNATAILDITGFDTQIGSITGGGATGGNVTLGAATLTVGGDNTSPAAYAGAISGTGGLTKIGTGTQILTGTNTYTGATSVSAGTLALVGGSQASPITVSPGASLSFTLGSSTSSTSTFNVSSGTIKISGTPTLPSYTLISASTGITGTPTLDAAIPGYALKVVGNTLVLENPYEVWAAANGATGGKAADPDGDGFNNLMEFAFGTDPTVNSAGSIAYSGGAVTATGQPVLEEDGGVYYAVFARRTDYVAAGLTYTVQFTAGLDQWVTSVTVPTVVATDGTIDAVRVPFPNFVASPSGPKKPHFFRVTIAD
jgi:fibronectin-binding autotransporter adhesin